MDPSVKQRAALLLSLLLFSHSDSDPSAVSGLYPELQSDDQKLSVLQDFSTPCREKEQRNINTNYIYSNVVLVLSNCLVHGGKLVLNIINITSA